jgi:NAD(P) transhydrogenase subunit alpha
VIIGVPKEIFPRARRVALVPAALPSLTKAGCGVLVQAGAGARSFFPDAAYLEKGARIATSRAEVFQSADVLFQVLCHGANDKTGREDLPLLRPEHVLIGFFRPLGSPETVQEVAATGVTAFAVDLIPRITRAQNMDALSSMATLAGYKAVLTAATNLPRMFPMMMTAAGTLKPAHVLVVGTGVAGLQAIATARRLGAVVSAYDIRPATRDEVRSLGARFVELPLEAADAQDVGGYAKAQDESFYRRQAELLGRVVAESDVVITTALVRTRKAPVLITAEMVTRMPPGSVIVDLAAERGGNCELTRPYETVVEHGVKIIGAVNAAGTVPTHASQMYARNISAFFLHLLKLGIPRLTLEDEITRQTLLTRGGEVVHAGVRTALGLPSLEGAAQAAAP